MKHEYVARHPWSKDRPETLVVCCSDGRWHAQVEEFCRHAVDERADLYAVPGGAAAFEWHNSSHRESKVLEDAFRLLAEHHNLNAVWLIAHEGCAYYHIRHKDLGEEAIVQRQRDDMIVAHHVINTWYPHLAVRQIYASLKDGRVVFTTILDDGAIDREEAG